MYVNTELIGVIAAAIALGTAMLASFRSLRQEIRDVREDVREVRSDVRDVRSDVQNIREDVDEGRSDLQNIRKDLQDTRDDLQNIRHRVDRVRGELRDEVKALETRLRAEIQSGFKELAARVINIGDRLSKVEGIIEGMFWSGRNQSPDKKREGVA